METLHFLFQHHREILYFLLLWHVQLLYNIFCSQNEDVLKYDFVFHFGDVPASAIFYIYITFMFACHRWYCSVSSSFMYILSTFSSNVPFHHSIDILSAVVVLVLMLKKILLQYNKQSNWFCHNDPQMNFWTYNFVI